MLTTRFSISFCCSYKNVTLCTSFCVNNIFSNIKSITSKAGKIVFNADTSAHKALLVPIPDRNFCNDDLQHFRKILSSQSWDLNPSIDIKSK